MTLTDQPLVQDAPSMVITDNHETNVMIVKIPPLKIGSALWLECAVSAWLKHGTAITVCLYRGEDRVLLDTARVAYQRGYTDAVVHVQTMDRHPGTFYTVAVRKSGRWSVECAPQIPRWMEFAR